MMIEGDSSMKNPKPFILALRYLNGYTFEYRDCWETLQTKYWSLTVRY